MILLVLICIIIALLIISHRTISNLQERVIVTCFAGREKNMEILMTYIYKLLNSHKIYQFHIWNYSRNENDEKYLYTLQSDNCILINPIDKNSFIEYYTYYKENSYDDDIIIKLDDDILFIDVDAFDMYIKEVRENNFLLMFPSIINNGVCAWHQQQNELIPDTLHTFKYEPFMGDVVTNGKLGTKLHEYFLNNKQEFIKKSNTLKTEKIPIGDRTSINLFAIKGADFKKTNYNGGDDEHYMSVEFPKNVKKHNAIFMKFVVSHGGFGAQRDTGMDDDHIRKIYKDIIIP